MLAKLDDTATWAYRRNSIVCEMQVASTLASNCCHTTPSLPYISRLALALIASTAEQAAPQSTLSGFFVKLALKGSR